MLPIFASALLQVYNLPTRPNLVKYPTERAVLAQNKQVPHKLIVEVPGIFGVLGNTLQACASKFSQTYDADWLGRTDAVVRTGADP